MASLTAETLTLVWKNGSRWNGEPDPDDLVSNVVNHGVCDERGRAVGGYAEIRRLSSAYGDRAGKYELSVFAARNGEKYGAIPPHTLYDTIEAAQSAAVPALLAQRKRYSKKYAPCAERT